MHCYDGQLLRNNSLKENVNARFIILRHELVIELNPFETRVSLGRRSKRGTCLIRWHLVRDIMHVRHERVALLFLRMVRGVSMTTPTAAFSDTCGRVCMNRKRDHTYVDRSGDMNGNVKGDNNDCSH